jgi:hypothetical protein
VCHAQTPTVESTSCEYALDLPCFEPAKITFNFPYTTLASIYDITTIGGSSYKYGGTPTTFEFIVEDVDDYFFTFELRYNQTMNQTMLVGFWSGTQAMQGLDYKGSFERVLFHVRLRVTREPTYPSEEEVAKAVVTQVQKNLEDYYKAMNELIAKSNSLTNTNTWLSLMSIVFVIVFGAIFLLETNRMRQKGAP